MIEIGRLCVKLAGRDAGLKCVIVDIDKEGYALIDGQTRRRKCNPSHLEPLSKVIKIKKGASHADVSKEFKKLKIEVRDTNPKKATDRPKKSKAKKEVPKEYKEKKKAEKPKSEKKEKSEKRSPPKAASKEAKEKPSRSTVEAMTKDEIKDYAQKEFGVELTTNDTKKEMLDKLFKEL